MISTFVDRERAYRRRLYRAAPFAVVIILILFVSSEHVSLEILEKHIGWKGELQVMPEITIVPDDATSVSFERQRNLHTMTTVDLDLPEGHDIDQPEFENVHREEEIEELDFNEWDEFQVRTVRRNRDVPYSEDYVILKMVEPEYALHELNDGVEGHVLVELFVNTQGSVEDVEVISVLGPKSFEEASLKAVRQFVFQPPVENGAPATMWIRFNIRFRISG